MSEIDLNLLDSSFFEETEQPNKVNNNLNFQYLNKNVQKESNNKYNDGSLINRAALKSIEFIRWFFYLFISFLKIINLYLLKFSSSSIS